MGYINIYFSTDGETWIEKTNFFYEKIRYCDSFEDVVEELQYEDVENKWNFIIHKPWFSNKKEYKIYDYFHHDDPFIIHPNQTLYVKKSWSKSNGTLSFERLSRDMDVEEFIAYIKDNGINICPITGNV